MKGTPSFDRWARRPASWLIVALCLAAFCGCDRSGESVVAEELDNAATRKSAQEALTAQGAKVTVEQMPMVGGDIFAVDLSGVKSITDETFTLLKRLQAGYVLVWKLNLSGTNITDEQMAKLNDKELSAAVTKLNLRNTGITDRGLHEITNMTSLSELDLTNTKVTAEGVQAFLKSRADNPDIQSKKPKIKR